jgi:DNA-binding transcriptional ArsR family regulator
VDTYGEEEIWGALGDRTRRSIVLLLADGPSPVGKLADALPVSRPAVSQHLRVLKEAGLVDEEAEGTRRIYRLNEVGMLALRDQLDTFWNRALGTFRDVAEQAEQPEENDEPN